MSDYSWLGAPPEHMPTIIQHWNGLTSITLSKIGSLGARLMWVFDEDIDQLGVFVHLTSDEAQIIYDTPPEVGLLERVRSRLTDREAVAWKKSGDVIGVTPFTIPTDGTEADFADSLWDAAEEPVQIGSTARDSSIVNHPHMTRPRTNNLASYAAQAWQTTLEFA